MELLKKGEKIASFVKYEKELESSYRRRLEEVKRPEEVGKVFVEFAMKFMEKVKGVPKDAEIHIKFVPENEGEPFKIDDKLIEYFGEDIVEKSDFMAILRRMAQTAQHRYKKLKSDDERTDLFRMGDNAKIK